MLYTAQATALLSSGDQWSLNLLGYLIMHHHMREAGPPDTLAENSDESRVCGCARRKG